MCGIAGLASKDQILREDILSMTSCLAHRGPDATDILINSNATVALGHTRLSVIDLSAGANQPMVSADGIYSIVFNGEIYNYKSLRQELKSLGRTFVTGSDTEVILQGFVQWGPTLCQKLEGMFAFAIYNHMENLLFLCRDRVGKKPLFYFQSQALIGFASEIKALLKHPAIRRSVDINLDAIYTFLHVGYIPEPATVYNMIKKFPAGHFSFVKPGAPINFVHYGGSLADVDVPASLTTAQATAHVKTALTEAVAKRLIADVPIGAFLSGGTDSSLIVALASQLKSDPPLKTFSIGFSKSQFDETNYARKVARKLNTDHREYLLAEEEAVNLLETYLTHFDEPFADTSAIPTMLVSKLARKDVTVALTGDGGDELFLGYGMYDWADRLDKFWIRLFRSPLAFGLKKLGNSRLKRIGFLLEKVAASEIRSHIFSQEQYFFTRKEIRSMAITRQPGFEVLNYDDGKLNLNAAEKQALFDIQFYLRDDLLVKVDRASMFYGLECRCPFLDERVMRLALGLPYRMKIRGNERKWILKEILKEYLPEELVYRPKWGFSIPLAHWMKNDLAYLIERYLNRSVIDATGIVDYDYVQKLKTSFLHGRDFLYNRLWVLIAAHKWLSENDR